MLRAGTLRVTLGSSSPSLKPTRGAAARAQPPRVSAPREAQPLAALPSSPAREAALPRAPQRDRLRAVLSSLSSRAQGLIVGAVAAVAAFFVFGGARSARGGPAEPLDAIPQGSFLVATVDVAELRRSPIFSALADEPTAGEALGAAALGVGGLARSCGFDPLSRVERLAVAVPEHGERGEIGVAARITVSRDELSKCARALAGERGGALRTSRVGRFDVVEAPASEGQPGARLAYGDGGLLVVGQGTFFDAMLSAAEGRAPRIAEPWPDDPPAHAALRASLSSRGGHGAPTLLVTTLVPSSVRARVEREMLEELSRDGGAAPRDAERTMSGLLGISAAGLALHAGGAAERVELAAELRCEAEDACAAAAELLSREAQRWSRELTLRMLGLGPLLDSIDVAAEEKRVRVTAGAPSAPLASALGRVLRLSGRTPPAGP